MTNIKKIVTLPDEENGITISELEIQLVNNELVTSVFARIGTCENNAEKISFVPMNKIGKGCFNEFSLAKIRDTGKLVVIKQVSLDPNIRSRELKIWKELNHPNILSLLYWFYTPSGPKLTLHLTMEYIPYFLCNVIEHSVAHNRRIPIGYIILYMYQLFRGLAYIHSLGISHRDINPKNLVVNKKTGVLKICGFGRSKKIVEGRENVLSLWMGHYRAPELLCGATTYNLHNDIWSAGCILAELFMGQKLFNGNNIEEQLQKIYDVVKPPKTWKKIIPNATTNAIDLISKLVVYKPDRRLTAFGACAHKFFDILRELPANFALPTGHELPPLFNFTAHESEVGNNFMSKLKPKRDSICGNKRPCKKFTRIFDFYGGKTTQICNSDFFLSNDNMGSPWCNTEEAAKTNAATIPNQ